MGLFKRYALLFFNFSPKRKAELERQNKELQSVESRRQKLVNLCKTRWVARIEAYEVFMELFPDVVSTLEIVSTENGWNSESSQKATSLLTAITQFEFLMAFVVTKHGFGFTKGLTVSLQSHSKISAMPTVRWTMSFEHYMKFVRRLTHTTKSGTILPLLWEVQSMLHHPFLVDVVAKEVEVMYQQTRLKCIIGDQLPFPFWMNFFHT